MRRRARPRIGVVVWYTAVTAGAFVMLYPVLWMVASSVRPAAEIFTNLGLVVTEPDWSNFVRGWTGLERPFGHYLWNSVVLCAGAIAGTVISCSMAAYAFARLDFLGRRVGTAMVIGSLLLPIHVIIVPNYIVFSKLDLINTFWPILLPKLLGTDAFFVFMMMQFIRGIPRELDDAARIDGCGPIRIFLVIILPLIKPALATSAIFTFLWTWNDYFSQLIYLTKPQQKTATVALASFMDSSEITNWGPMFAMGLLTLVPLFLVFTFFQRYLLHGMASTGFK